MAQFIGNLSLIGFLDGITAIGIIISSVFFGIFSFYKARKIEARLLSVAGLMMIFVGLLWLGPAIDFFFVLFTGKNIYPLHLYAWLSYLWVFPAVIVGFYIGAELMMPEKKKIIIGIYAVLGIIFEIIIFIMPQEVFIIVPPLSGDLIDSGFNRVNPAYWLILFFQVSVLIFLGIGFAIKAKQSTGELRKKFIYLAVGACIFFICGILDALTRPGVYLVIWRTLMMTYSLWMYLGLKT